MATTRGERRPARRRSAMPPRPARSLGYRRLRGFVALGVAAAGAAAAVSFRQVAVPGSGGPNGLGVHALGPPGIFAPGACVSYPPIGPDRHETVLLDPGHGGPDPGSAGSTQSGATVYEARFTLPVARDAALLLRADGDTVVLSRTGNGPVARLGPKDLDGSILTDAGEHADTADRVLCANEAGAAALVSIHFNAFGDPTAGGTLTTYDPDRPFSSRSLELAELLQRDVVGALGRAGWTVPSRGVVSDTTVGAPALTAKAASYGHLFLLGPADPGFNPSPSTMPGALIEPLFITDPDETAIVASRSGQETIAAGIASAVEQFLARKA